MWFMRKDKQDEAGTSKDKAELEVFVKEIARHIALFEGKIEVIQQRVNSLQGLVNRKLGNFQIEDAEDVTDSVKNDDGFDEVRKMRSNAHD